MDFIWSQDKKEKKMKGKKGKGTHSIHVEEESSPSLSSFSNTFEEALTSNTFDGQESSEANATPSDNFNFPEFATSATPPNQPDAVDISSSEYARKRKELMELTNDLRAMGAQTLIDLPRIAVIGGQSVGKSSLVEAVSGINVPRDAGTCTRCPMECTLSSNATSWSCQVSLRLDYDNHGRSLPESSTIRFGPPITDKNEVEIWLRRAQVAILSTNPEPGNYSGHSIEQLRHVIASDANMQKFSKNAICVDINDPDATDLSFVDLPGLIQNESPEAIDLVRKLVESYIAKERTFILVTIPMGDDMENQQAVRLAKEADSSGERTIGVLTKPDMLSRGTNAREKWKSVLQGRTHPLKHGYYCVRLPDDDERARNVTRGEAQQIATAFFESETPWNEFTDRSRLGISNFVSDISRLLMGVIERALPDLKREVRRFLEDCNRDLAKLPVPLTTDLTTEILGRITIFCTDLHAAVYGGSQDKRLVQRNRASYSIFKGGIAATAPDFRPFLDPTQYSRPQPPAGEVEFTSDHSRYEVMGLYDVRKVIEESKAWELPNHVPHDAGVLLIEKFIQLWNHPAVQCFDAVQTALSEVVEQLLKKHFGRFRVLEKYIRSIVLRKLAICKSEALRSLHTTLDLEKSPYFTQNTDYLASSRNKWLQHYRQAKLYPQNYARPFSHRGPGMNVPIPRAVDALPLPSPRPQALETLSEVGYAALSMEDFRHLHNNPDDTFEEEMIVMASVRAYFQVAYKRIIDYIPLTIEHALNQALADELQIHLISELDVGGADASTRFQDLLSEDPTVKARREELESNKRRLMEIQRKLNNFRF